MTNHRTNFTAKVEAARGPCRRRRAEAIIAQYIREISARRVAAPRRVAIGEAR